MEIINSIIIISLWISLIILSAIFSRKFFPNKKELSRKIVHIGIGPIIPLAWWLQIPDYIAIPFAIVITIGLMINQRLNLLTAIEDINRNSYGTTFYGLSITILLFLFWTSNPNAVCAGVLVMAFGDGLAGLIGQQLKSPTWKIFGQTKSVAGTMTMGFSSFFILFILSLVSNLSISVSLLIFLSLIAMILEQFGAFGADNLTVPIAIAYGWKLFTIN